MFRVTSRGFARALLLLVLAGCQTPQSQEPGSPGTITATTVHPHAFRPEDRRASLLDLGFHSLYIQSLGPDGMAWYQNVITLSGAWFAGRADGTPGFYRASDFLAWSLEHHGLEPAFHGDSGDTAVWRQQFEYPANGGHTESLNVAGVLPGSGGLGHEWIVIGAHFDHLGHHSPGPTDTDQLYPGADDNASGVASVLLMAYWLGEVARLDPSRPRRSVLFVLFGGEEAGLHGSRYFIAHPPVDLAAITMMANFDMVGRLHKQRLMITGTGTAAEFDALLARFVPPSGLQVLANPTVGGPSDHAPFLEAGIPALFFFTGIHRDYHQPTDTAMMVNPVGAVKVTELAWEIVAEVMSREQRLTAEGE